MTTPSRRTFLSGMAAGAAMAWLPLDGQAQAPEASKDFAMPIQPTTTGSADLPNPLDEPVTAPNVGSLLGPLTRMRDGAGFATRSFAADRYKATDHAAWRAEMHQAVMDCLHYAPQKTDFAVKTLEKVDCGKYVREKIYFNTTPALRVPAYVLVPKDLKGRAPAIVGLHDHGGFFHWGMEKLVRTPNEHPSLTAFKQECYAGHSIADDLAEQGYVVIVIDMFFWGERRPRFPDTKDPAKMTDAEIRRGDSQYGQLEAKNCRRVYNAGMTWTGIQFWDDIRTVDYLTSRPEVDPERIGCVGLSVGSFRSGHLIALDQRVKAAIECCWLTSWRDFTMDNMSHVMGFGREIPGIYQKLDVPDVISLAAPRALFCINGLKDNLYPVEEGVKPSYRILEAVYKKLGAPEKFKGKLFDTPHEFNEEMQQEAWAWFRQWV